MAVILDDIVHAQALKMLGELKIKKGFALFAAMSNAPRIPDELAQRIIPQRSQQQRQAAPPQEAAGEQPPASEPAKPPAKPH